MLLIKQVYFLDEGKVRDELYHEGGNAKYKFYYHAPDGSMLYKYYVDISLCMREK